MWPDLVDYLLIRDMVFPAQLTAREQSISAVAIVTGGMGYALNDTITLAGGVYSQRVILTVTTVMGGAVSGVSIANQGAYSVLPANPVAQGSTSGGGSGASFALTFNPTYLYSWVEQVYAVDNTLVAAFSPREGNAFIQAAQEINNNLVAPLTYVWMRLAHGNGGSDQTYEFTIPPTTGASSTTLTYNNDTITYNDCSITYNSDTTTVNNSLTVYNNDTFTVKKTSYFQYNTVTYQLGIGPLVYEVPFELCGFSFWCCQQIQFIGPGSGVWVIPQTTQSTLYTITSITGDTTLTGMIPYAAPRVVQSSPGISAHLVNSAADTFTTTPAGAPNQLIVKAFGKSATTLSSASITVGDNQGASNVYSADTFTQNTTGGAFAGIWRCSTPSVTFNDFSVSFGFAGAVTGDVSLVADEVYGLNPPTIGGFHLPILDKASSSIGTGMTASAGSITAPATYGYQALVVGSDDSAAPSSLTINTPPIGYQESQLETDGSQFAPGVSAWRISAVGDSSTITPTVSFVDSVHWAGVQATYVGKSLPQLVAIVNEGFYQNSLLTPFNLIFQGFSDQTTYSQYSFRLPGSTTQYTPSTVTSSLIARPFDAYIWWYDACVSLSWILLASPGMTWTLVGKTGGGGLTAASGSTAGSGTVEVYYANGTGLTDCSISLTALNLSTSPVGGSAFGVLSLEPTSKQFVFTPANTSGASSLAVFDTHGNSVTGVSSATFIGTGSASVTVTPASGTGSASVTINVPSGASGFPPANGMRLKSTSVISVSGSSTIAFDSNSGTVTGTYQETGSSGIPFWDSSTPGDFTINVDGYYHFSLEVDWSNFGIGSVLLNSSIVNETDGITIAEVQDTESGTTLQEFWQDCSQDYFCNAGDIIHVVVENATGGGNMANVAFVLFSFHQFG